MFNYNVAPYAPFWSLRAIESTIKEIEAHEIDVPIFDREARAGIKYQIAQALEYKTMEIFKQIWSEKKQSELVVTGFQEARYQIALKKLLLITTTVYTKTYVKIEDIKDGSEQNNFKIIWQPPLPGCFEDTINHFNNYHKLLEKKG